MNQVGRLRGSRSAWSRSSEWLEQISSSLPDLDEATVHAQRDPVADAVQHHKKKKEKYPHLRPPKLK